jgi:hypothetical protein
MHSNISAIYPSIYYTLSYVIVESANFDQNVLYNIINDKK